MGSGEWEVRFNPVPDTLVPRILLRQDRNDLHMDMMITIPLRLIVEYGERGRAVSNKKLRIDFEHYESAILKFKGLDSLSLVVRYGFNDRHQSPINTWVRSSRNLKTN